MTVDVLRARVMMPFVYPHKTETSNGESPFTTKDRLPGGRVFRSGRSLDSRAGLARRGGGAQLRDQGKSSRKGSSRLGPR